MYKIYKISIMNSTIFAYKSQPKCDRILQTLPNPSLILQHFTHACLFLKKCENLIS